MNQFLHVFYVVTSQKDKKLLAKFTS